MRKLLAFVLATFVVWPVFSQSTIADDKLILFMAEDATPSDLNNLMDELEMEVIEGPTSNLGAILVQFNQPPIIPPGGNPTGPVSSGKEKAKTKSEVVGVGFDYALTYDHTPSSNSENCFEILDPENQPNGGNNILTGIFDTGISSFATTEALPYFDPNDIGYNLLEDQAYPIDEHGHGTHIASIVMNNLDNDNEAIQLKAYKTHNSNGQGSLFDVIKALDLAITDGVDIINMSFVYMEEKQHGVEPKNAFKVALSRAFNLSDMLVVAAAGNDNLDNDISDNLVGLSAFPASFNDPNIISVASANCARKKSFFSNYGINSVDVFAPGENILGYDQNWELVNDSGTSQATAFVTQLATYLGSHQSQFDPQAVKCAIMNGTKPMKNTGFTVTDGIINSNKALQQLNNNCSNDYFVGVERSDTQQSVSYLGNKEQPTFEITADQEKTALISVFNLNGQMLLSGQILLNEGSHNYAFDFKQTGGIGLYFLVIQTNDGLKTLKFIR